MTWTRCLPNDRGNDGAEDEHMKIQRKAWRARCVLGSQSRMLDIALVCFLGAPLEHLVVQLDRLDEAGNCIYEMMVDDTNPIKRASAEVCKLTLPGAEGPMSPIYAHFQK